jgi:hypothetical protein
MDRKNVLRASLLGGLAGAVVGMAVAGWISIGVMGRALPDEGGGGFVPFLISAMAGAWIGCLAGAAVLTNVMGSAGVRSALTSFWLVAASVVVLGLPVFWLLPDSMDVPVSLFPFPLAAAFGAVIGRLVYLRREEARTKDL